MTHLSAAATHFELAQQISCLNLLFFLLLFQPQYIPYFDRSTHMQGKGGENT